MWPPPVQAPWRTGKVERFIRYLRGSLYVPFASRMGQDGIVVDAHAANAAVRRYMREVANARVHATTDAVPVERLEEERAALQPVPAPWGGTILRGGPSVSASRIAAPLAPLRSRADGTPTVLSINR